MNTDKDAQTAARRDLLIAIRRGGRWRSLLGSLPLESQEKLYRDAGIPIRKGSPVRGSTIQGHVPQYMKCLENDHCAWQLIAEWGDPAIEKYLEDEWKDLQSWEEGLIFLLCSSSESSPEAAPESLIKEALRVVADISYQASKSTIRQWNLWMKMASGLINLRKIKGDVLELQEQILKVWSIPGFDVGPTDPFLALARIKDLLMEAAGRIESRLKEWKEEILSITMVLEPPDSSISDSPELVDFTRIQVIEDAISANLAALGRDSAQNAVRMVMTIPSRLTPKPPPRDCSNLNAEVETIRTALERDQAAQPEEYAPTLWLLSKRLISGETWSESELDTLEDLVSARFFHDLEADRVRLSPEPGLEEMSDSVTGEEVKTGGQEKGAVLGLSENPTEAIEPSMAPAEESTPKSPAEKDVVAEAPVLIDESLAEIVPIPEPHEENAEEQSGITRNIIEKPSLPEQKLENEHELASPMQKLEEKAAEEPPEPDGTDPQAIARWLKGLNEIQPPQAEVLLGALILKRELDWAYWIDKALGKKSLFPNGLIELAELGLQYRPGFRNSEDRLRELYDEVALELEHFQPGDDLLLGAALVRPALMAPQTYPVFLLREIARKPGLVQRMGDLFEALADLAERGGPPPGELFKGLGNAASWETDQKALQMETDRWLAEAHKRDTRYQLASMVWERLAGSNGELRNLVDLCSQAVTAPEKKQEELSKWGSSEDIDRIIHRTAARMKHKNSPKFIHSGAREALHRYVNDALDLAGRWVDLYRQKPQDDMGYGQRTVEHLREIAEQAMRNVELFTAKDCSFRFQAELARLKDSIREIVTCFEGGTAIRLEQDPASEDLTRGRNQLLLLLNLSGMTGFGFPPAVDNGTLLEPTLAYLANPTDIESIILQHLQIGRIEQARQLHQISGASPDAQSRTLSLIEESAKRWRRDAENRIEALRGKVETFLMKGAITDLDQNLFSSRGEKLERQRVEHPDNPGYIVSQIESLEKELDGLAQNRRQGLESRIRIAEMKVPVTDAQKALLCKLMDSEDFSAAEEMLAALQSASDRGETGLVMPSVETEERFLFEDFLSQLPRLYEACADINTLVKSIRDGTLDTSSTLRELDPQHREAMAEVPTWWRTLLAPQNRYSSSNDFNGALSRLLRWMGYQLEAAARYQEISRMGPPNHWLHYRVSATLDSPIPLFGSQSGGWQDIVLVWNVVDPEGVAQYLQNNKIAKDRPTAILFLNRMDASTRRRMIHTVRRAGYCPLLIDLALLAWLFGQKNRTLALFQAALAGGSGNPYMPEIAGALPKEMFFGRERDIDRLWSLEGPCIVYGGRQLGKSALLQQVLRRFHDPKKGCFVLYSGINNTVGIWDQIRHLLEMNNLLPTKGLVLEDRIQSAIAKMLRETPGRRVLILLDECDRFIDQDAKDGFQKLNRIRDLMQETERRFKVVFTGLHSVQRFQRQPNHPLAHFGDPLCIGPLASRPAFNLVRQPLEVLGYRFKEDILVYRVLANTNYHPCLIQLFCRELVQSMLSSTRTNQDRTPPFHIDEQAITQVYRKSNLIRQMRDRFDWTLDLDKRYRAIGYSVAWMDMTGDQSNLTPEGLRISEILDTVRETWPQAFENTGTDELAGLLEEMVGLGVLLVTSDRRYRLRSPNVLRLLGGENEVLEELTRIRGENFEPPEMDPPVAHRNIPQKGFFGESSPLTLFQEDQLAARRSSLDLIAGSEALGIHQVFNALSDLFQKQGDTAAVEIIRFENKVSATSTLERLKNRYSKVSQNNIRIMIDHEGVPPSVFEKFLFECGQWMRTLHSEQHFIQVITTLSPGDLVFLMADRKLTELEKKPKIRLYYLKRWQKAGLRHWFHDRDLVPPERGVPESLYRETGGWPALLHTRLSTFLGHEVKVFDDTGLENMTGVNCHPRLQEIYRILAQLGEEVGILDLETLVMEEKISPALLRSVVRCLLDLGLATGSEDNVRAEPVMAAVLSKSKTL